MEISSPASTTPLVSTQLSTSIFEKNIEKYYLSVISKRTYTINKNGTCSLAETQAQLVDDIVYYDATGELMEHDIDLYPIKPYTDVVIKGNANGINNCNFIQASVEIEKQNAFKINVYGNRKAYKNNTNKIVFTEPEKIESIPLRYDFAYGGIDHVAENKLPEVPKHMIKANPNMDWGGSSLYRYPRNTSGKGYIVHDTPEAFENLALPNLEIPNKLLTPQNLVLNDPYNWVNQPIPRATDWLNLCWFPRIAYIGILPFDNKERYIKDIPEIFGNFVDHDILQTIDKIVPFNIRASNGASLGLQFANMMGNESIRLKNIHPQNSDFVLQLPDDIPKICVDGRKGKLLDTKPFIHTILIETEENRVSIIWRGSAPALRPYHSEELKTMPFKVEWNKK